MKKQAVFCLFSYSNPQESGFYYLQSRYYDPNTCRFINADGFASTGQGFLGCNMFAYCLNSPVNRIDSHGTIPITTYIVKSTLTGEPEEDKKGNRTYTITVSYTVIVSDTSQGYITSYDSTSSIQFRVTSTGFATIDNAQDSAGILLIGPIRRAVASEIQKTVNRDFAGESLLKGRTVDGLEFEMLTHICAFMLGVQTGPSSITAMGGTDRGEKGHDENALAFEDPIHHLDLWWEMISGGD